MNYRYIKGILRSFFIYIRELNIKQKKVIVIELSITQTIF